MALHAFSDLRRVAFCPRQLYYARRDEDRSPPPDVERRRALAYRYDELIDADNGTLSDLHIDISPLTFRRNLRRTRERIDRFDALVDPSHRDVLLTGRECRGVVHKCLDDPPVPSLVATGTPPKQGVWEPQSVHAVAAAKALAWERKRPVERAYVEYPTHGIVRSVSIDGRRKAQYRDAIRTVESLGTPPPRLQNDTKCSACEYSEQCGVETRTLRSLLGFG
ncbi:CRISPR-associated protein Cas4 [Natranaeroarchaeum aerophilus]|uniref:CRISPR-associated protein Cas4 n=1 Tax=Natranaeroarchaeum aerophilus TaxID=2917711 RepID=A0AAE3FN62_9EURY|nr:Dna2/Cas4 domain-containing protein [Natranaeroarchaeum aerophilus]MCL9812244.1 CRISPR-associated protein Cas4 [Natranaeroarchaeum aerophilus]